jgi:hypothetical protein
MQTDALTQHAGRHYKGHLKVIVLPLLCQAKECAVKTIKDVKQFALGDDQGRREVAKTTHSQISGGNDWGEGVPNTRTDTAVLFLHVEVWHRLCRSTTSKVLAYRWESLQVKDS